MSSVQNFNSAFPTMAYCKFYWTIKYLTFEYFHVILGSPCNITTDFVGTLGTVLSLDCCLNKLANWVYATMEICGSITGTLSLEGLWVGNGGKISGGKAPSNVVAVIAVRRVLVFLGKKF